MTLQMASNYLRDLLNLERETQRVLLMQGGEQGRASEDELEWLIEEKIKQQQA